MSTKNTMAEYAEGQVEKVLEAIGLNVAGDAPNDLIVFCPYHSNHRTPAAEVSKDTGVFYCFACQKHASLVDLVRHESGVTFFEALRLIDTFKVESNIVDSIRLKLEQENKYEPFDQNVLERLHSNLASHSEPREYLQSRGISTDSMIEYFLGYSIPMDMVTFPYYDPEGRFVVGFQARSVSGKEFKNSTGTKKSQTLYGIQHHKWDSEVFLFESPIDSILAHQYEIPAVSTMGANPSKTQIALLTSHYKTIYVVADNDSAGKASAFKLCEKLDGRGIMVLPPEGVKDIGEMNIHEIPRWAEHVKNPVNSLLGEI